MTRSAKHGTIFLIVTTAVTSAAPSDQRNAPDPKPADENVVGRLEDEGLVNDLLDDDPRDAAVTRAARRARELMTESQRRLEAADTGRQTQDVQAEISRHLDAMLDEMEKPDRGRPPRAAGGGGCPGGAAVRPPAGGGGNGIDKKPAPPPQGKPPASRPATDPVRPPSDTDLASRVEPVYKISPRLRAAVIEGAGETVSERYRVLIEDYYTALARRAAAAGTPGGEPPEPARP